MNTATHHTPGRHPLDDTGDLIDDLAYMRRLIARVGPVKLFTGGRYADAILEGSVRGVFDVQVDPNGRRYRITNARPLARLRTGGGR